MSSAKSSSPTKSVRPLEQITSTSTTERLTVGQSQKQEDAKNSQIQSMCFRLLTDGHISSFINFFKISHELKTSGDAVNVENIRPASAESSMKKLLPIKSTPPSLKGALAPRKPHGYSQKPILPEDSAEKLAFLEEFDPDRKRNLYALSTLKEFQDLITTSEDSERMGKWREYA